MFISYLKGWLPNNKIAVPNKGRKESYGTTKFTDRLCL